MGDLLNPPGGQGQQPDRAQLPALAGQMGQSSLQTLTDRPSVWPQNPAPGEMSWLQRAGYATAGPQGLQRAEQDVRAQVLHDADWANAHPDEFAMLAARSFAGADITADVPGGISGRAHLGEDQSGGDMFKHFPVLDEQNRQVGYLDVHQVTGADGKKLAHVDMLSVRGGHNLLPIFRQIRDFFPEAEGVLAQRISGLGNTRGAEHVYRWPRAFREGAEKVQGPSFTGMREAAQTAGAKQELGATMAGAPTAPGGPSFTGPQPPSAAVPPPGTGRQALSDIMLTPPARDPRGALPARTAAARAAADETYPAWMAREHPEVADPYAPFAADRYQQEWVQATRAARQTAAAPLATTTGPRPNLPYWREWVESAPGRRYGRDVGITYRQWLERYHPDAATPGAAVPTEGAAREELHVRRGQGAPPHMDEWRAATAPGSATGAQHYSDWLHENYPDEWARRYEVPRRGLSERTEGTDLPHEEEYVAAGRPGGTYSDWLRQNYPDEAERRYGPATTPGIQFTQPSGQTRESDLGRTQQAVQQHLGGQPAPHWDEYQQSQPGFNDPHGQATAYADWLTQNYPEEARARYGGGTADVARLQRTPGTPENQATVEADLARQAARQPRSEQVGEYNRMQPPDPDISRVEANAPHFAEYQSLAAGRVMRPYPEWLRLNYPQEYQQRYPYMPARARPGDVSEADRAAGERASQEAAARRARGATYRPGETYLQWLQRNYPTTDRSSADLRAQYDELRRADEETSGAMYQRNQERLRQQAAATPEYQAGIRQGETAAERARVARQQAPAPTLQPSFTGPRPVATYNRGEGFRSWVRRNYPNETPGVGHQQEYDRLRVREWRARTAREGAERVRARQQQPTRDWTPEPSGTPAAGVAPQPSAQPSASFTGAAGVPAAGLPRAQEYFAATRGSYVSYPDWLRRTYPQEAEARYGRPAAPSQPSFTGPQQPAPSRPPVSQEGLTTGEGNFPNVPSEPFEAWFARLYPGESLARQSRERLGSLIRQWGETAQAPPAQPAAAPTP